MSGIRGLILGVVGLALAEAVVSSKTATANANAAVRLFSDGLARWLDPSVPLIPDLRGTGQQLPGTLGKTPTPNAPGGTPGTTAPGSFAVPGGGSATSPASPGQTAV